MLVGSYEAVTGVVYYQEMVWAWVVKESGYLHAELDARICAIRNLPALRMEMIYRIEELVECY